ncbi:MAG: carboxypeptidase-like regulatory domain-containing protein [Chitinophagaceae bacterium]|nr:carboxypeptidase-like regulatory domain-containing protein [Chitinophagaceae bacterium]
MKFISTVLCIPLKHFASFHLVILLTFTTAWAQEVNTVTGTVKDENGNPLVGVSITLKGTTTGTPTTAKGTFSISAQPNQTLIFSYTGYETQQIAVNRRNVINLSLTPDAQSLNKVVVPILYHGTLINYL